MLKKTLKVWNGQWDLDLPHMLGEYRRAPHESTGFTPSELLYGRQIRGPLQNLKEQWTAKEVVPTDVVNIHNHFARSIRGVTKGISG